MNNKLEVIIVKSWRNIDNARTVIFPLPCSLAKKYNIGKPANSYFVPREDRILLRKIDPEGIK